jgi:GT2 family glycosyltransferase
LIHPAAIIDVELSEPAGDVRLPASRDGGRYRSALALVRRDGLPVGSVVVGCQDGGVRATDLKAAIDEQLEPAEAAVQAPADPARPLPSVSVVVTTCQQPDSAARTASSILAGRLAPMELIVVENRPRGSTTESRLSELLPAENRVRYVEQPIKGLSAARNAGLAAALGEVTVFTDDDVIVDRSWLQTIATAFASRPAPGCVTGPIFPLELESAEQVLFEQLARLGKGWVAATYSLEHPPPNAPLFPYAAGHFGSGANVAIRTELVRALGGFDQALGVGTPAAGGEDLDLFIRVLLSGAAVRYEPAALVRHRHYDSLEELRRHAFNWGVGLTAAITKQLAHGPKRSELLRRVPAGVRYALDPSSAKNAVRDERYPRGLSGRELLGMAYGPFAYAASVRAARRAER